MAVSSTPSGPSRGSDSSRGAGTPSRYTPKKTPEKGKDSATREPAYRSSGRYTPPVPVEVKLSPKWVPILMFTLLILGLVTIILNYVELLPGAATNWYLLVGLGFITGGFITATQLR